VRIKKAISNATNNSIRVNPLDCSINLEFFVEGFALSLNIIFRIKSRVFIMIFLLFTLDNLFNILSNLFVLSKRVFEKLWLMYQMFYPTLTLPLSRRGNWIFIVSLPGWTKRVAM
jgi:hypothetical protein